MNERIERLRVSLNAIGAVPAQCHGVKVPAAAFEVARGRVAVV